MAQRTYYLYRHAVVLPGLRLWDLLRNLAQALFPRKVVVLGRLLFLASLLIPFGMTVGVVPLSFGLLFLALLGAATGSFACLLGPTFYIGGGDQALY